MNFFPYIEPEASMTTPASIFLFGCDRQLVYTRSLTQKKEGFRVHAAASVADIQPLPAGFAVDLMILCRTLSQQDCDEAPLITHERWPHPRTIALVSGS